MEIRYKRDLNSNYMVLTDEQPKEETYEVRMITENRIYGFLPCVSQKHEMSTEYYYEITGHQSMELLYERRKLKCSQLKGFLKELLRVLEAAQEYLLEPGHLILKPESIYLRTRSEKLYLCYYPGYEKSIRDSFLELAEYLLGKLDKSDTAGIEFGYELYQSALEPNFSLTEILQKHAGLEPKPEIPPAAPLPSVSVQEETLQKTGSWRNFFKKKPVRSQLEDYVTEAGMTGQSSGLFIREEAEPVPVPETACLQRPVRDCLFLKCVDGEYPDMQVQVNDGNFLIGKMKESVDGCIPAPTVSRIHARIYFDDTVYYLEDLNSTNGTWVDQVQLNPYELFPLQNGMHITFASVEYEVLL